MAVGLFELCICEGNCEPEDGLIEDIRETIRLYPRRGTIGGRRGLMLLLPQPPASARRAPGVQCFETLLTVREDPQTDDLQVLISVDEPFVHLVDEDWLGRVARSAMAVALATPEAAQMSLLIAGDETVKELNAEYRGLDEVTDVLSFSAGHQGHWEGDDEGPEDVSGVSFILPPGEPEPWGEVIVSYPQAKRQADEQGVSVDRELAHLVVHGVLHLTGHDHVEPEEAALMQAKEQASLAALGTWEPVNP